MPRSVGGTYVNSPSISDLADDDGPGDGGLGGLRGEDGSGAGELHEKIKGLEELIGAQMDQMSKMQAKEVEQQGLLKEQQVLAIRFPGKCWNDQQNPEHGNLTATGTQG